MTTLEQLEEIFNGWKDIILSQYTAKSVDAEKIWLQGRLFELNHIKNKLRSMLWTGQIKIQFKLEENVSINNNTKLQQHE